MNFKRNLLTCFFCVCALYACAQGSVQTDFKLKQLSPTSPEAATLGKFGDIPVGLYTGVPNISVPLYTLKLKNFELPIGLSYNSSGIKVEEVAPNTGLGWALNAGGNISQSINGLNDLLTGGFPNSSSDTIPDMVVSGDVLAYQTNQGDGGALYQWAKKVTDGTVDTQPDLFYYSYPGGSGKFYIDQHQQAHPIPFSAIKINAPPSYGTATIVDEQGRKFIYGDWEGTSTGSNCSTPSGNGTNLLTKIVLPNKETITFTYDTVNYSYKVQPPVSRNKAMPNTFGEHIYDCNTLNAVTTVTGKRLSTITASNGYIVTFKYLNSRTDLPGTKSLDTMIVSNGTKVIAKYTFNYGYFSTITNENADARRLKLLSVTNQNGGVYHFDYNESIALPNRMSFAQDHWGYYNGKTGNATLLPVEVDYGFLDGANRDVDSSYSQLCMLKKITYPTGGYTKFTYEQNDYYYVGTDNSYTTSTYSAYGQDNQLVTTDFTIPTGTNVIQGTVRFNDGLGGPGGTGLGDAPVDPATTVTISGNGINQQLYNGLSPDGTIYLSLSPGTYTISVNASGAANGAYCAIDVLTKQTTAVATNRLIGGLRIKTVASTSSAAYPEQIKAYVYRQKDDPTKSSGHINEYPSYTSTYTRLTYLSGPAEDCSIYGNPIYLGYYKQTTSSVYPLGSIKGGSVAYTFVTSLNGSTGQNGKTESTFTFSGISGGSISYPQVPFIDHDYENGLLLREVQYRNNGGTFQPLTQTHNFYSTQPESVFWNYHYSPSSYKSNATFRGRGLSIITKKPEVLCGLQLFPAVYLVNDYRFISEWVRQDSTVTSSYNYNASNVLTDSAVTFKHLTYGNPAHLLPTTTTTQGSNHNTIQATVSYPQDYAAGTSVAIDSLVAQHRLSTVLQSQVNNNASTITAKTLYRSWGNGIVEPEYEQSQYNSQAVENRLQYLGYDGVANLLSATQYGGLPVSYRWGYNKQHLITECRNALSDEFYYEGFEESTITGVTAGVSHTGNKYINTGSFTTSDKLAVGYHSKTYVISYWSKTGSGPWVYSGELAYTGQTLSGQLDDIRIYPKDAQMTTSTYEPLVGATSVTDAFGVTVYYEYDSFMRLMNVRDRDGKLLKHIDYHYQN